MACLGDALYAVTAALALTFTFAPRAWRHRHVSRRIIRMVAVAALALEATWLAPLASPSARVSQALETSGATQIRVMTCNVLGSRQRQSIVDAVREQHVQVLALQETTADFVEELGRPASASSPPPSGSSSDGVYGNGVWSAYLADVATDDIARPPRPCRRARSRSSARTAP